MILKDKQNQQTSAPAHQEERTQINKIKNEIWAITTSITKPQKIMKKYYEKLYANKMLNLEEMSKFLETYSLPILNLEETDNLNRPITRSEKKSVIRKTTCKQKSKTEWLHWGILPNIQRTYTYYCQSILKNWKEGNILKCIPEVPHHPDTKTKETTIKDN